MAAPATADMDALPRAEPVLLPALQIFGIALGLRVAFGLLTSNTYDYDEFVLLLLARDFAHGSVPYAGFMFFHPPGELVLLRAVEPLTAIWWPAARIGTEIVDSATAAMVWWIGARAFDRRTGWAAGLVYAASPLALIASVRVGQDPLITSLGVGAVACLVGGAGRRSAILAGVCLGLGLWIKYPALFFVPVCLALAPRRFPLVATAAAVTFAVLLLPVHGQWHLIYEDTVTFQRTRWTMLLDQRLVTVAIYWLGLNVLALPALLRHAPAWLRTGFLLGGLFLLTSQVYYHYFVPVIPFAALLAGRYLATTVRPSRLVAGALLAGTALISGLVVDLGGQSPLYVTAARLSDIAPTVRLLQRVTNPRDPILADRFEYAYLANRPALGHYFWNIGVLVNASYLERRVGHARAVVLSYGASSGYPRGFTPYLDARYPRVKLPANTVWLLPEIKPGGQGSG